MKLIITENPDAAKSLKKHLKEKDLKILSSGSHLYEPLLPHEHDPKLENWRPEDLPFWFPIKLKPTPHLQHKINEIAAALAEADTVIHAGNPDRESQLIVDTILEQLGWSGPVKRLEAFPLNGLDDLPDNGERKYRLMADAARARTEIDWNYGMNLSRAVGLRLNSLGIKETPAYGRIVGAAMDVIMTGQNVNAHAIAKIFKEHGLLPHAQEIVDTMKKRDLVFVRHNGVVVPTALATRSYEILPKELRSIQTAAWIEEMIREVESGANFREEIISYAKEKLEKYVSELLPECEICGKGRLFNIESKNQPGTFMWCCNRCNEVFDNDKFPLRSGLIQ